MNILILFTVVFLIILFLCIHNYIRSNHIWKLFVITWLMTILVFFSSKENITSFKFIKEGFYFEGNPLDISFGSSRNNDHLIVSKDIGTGYLNLKEDKGNLKFDFARRSITNGLVRVNSKYFNAYRLNCGDKILITVKGESIEIALKNDKTLINVINKEYDIPLRTIENKFGFKNSRKYDLTERVFPLDTLMKHLYPQRNLSAKSSYLFYTRGDAYPYFAVMDDNVRIIKMDQGEYERQFKFIVSEDEFSMDIFQLIKGTSIWRLKEIASYNNSLESNKVNSTTGLRISLTNPEIFAIRLSEILKNRRKNVFVTNMMIPYSGLSWKMMEVGNRYNVNGYISMYKSDDEDEFHFYIKTGTKPIGGNFKRIFHYNIDKSKLKGNLLLKIEYYSIPWAIIIFLTCLLLVKLRTFHNLVNNDAKGYRSGTDFSCILLTLVVLDFLLHLRLLFSYNSYLIYPFSKESLFNSLYAVIVLPFTLFAVWCVFEKKNLIDRSHKNTRSEAMIEQNVFSLIITSFLLISFDMYGFIYFLIFSCYLIPFLCYVFPETKIYTNYENVFKSLFSSLKKRFLNIQFLFFQKIKTKISKYYIHIKSDPTSDLLIMWVLGTYVFLLLIRCAVVPLGIKESIELFGQRFSLTIIYLPVFIFIGGYLLLWMQSKLNENKTKCINLLLIVMLGGVLLITLLMAIFVDDLGYAIISLPPFTLVIIYWILNNRSSNGIISVSKNKYIRYLILSGYFIFACGFSLYILKPFDVSMLVLKQQLNTIPSERVASIIRNDKIIQRMYLIDENSVKPELAEKIYSTRGIEQLRQTYEIMKTYGKSGFSGRGYGKSPVSQHIGGNTSLNDFAPLIFFISPFGYVAAILISLLMYLPISYLLFEVHRHKRPFNSRIKTFFFLISLISISTLFFNYCYMIGINMNIFPLSGKNIFLWGLNSRSDLIEGFVLWGLFCIPLLYMRKD